LAVEFGPIGDDDPDPGYVSTANVPATIAAAVSSGKATLAELDSVYSLEMLFDLLEIIHVDAYNERLARKAAEKD